jgi:hypothetical protein
VRVVARVEVVLAHRTAATNTLRHVVTCSSSGSSSRWSGSGALRRMQGAQSEEVERKRRRGYKLEANHGFRQFGSLQQQTCVICTHLDSLATTCL